NTSGDLSYTLNASVSGTSTFDVKVKDSGGTANGGVDTSKVQTFTIAVNFVNDEPTFTAGNPPAVAEDSGANTVTGFVTAFNPGGAPDANEAGQKVLAYTVSLIGNPALFTATGKPAIAANGNLTYTVAPGVTGTSTYDVQ